MKVLVKVVVVLAAMVAGVLLFAGSASAHAMLVSSTPSDGQRLSSAPTSVTLSFDEQVGIASLGYLHVTDPAGRRVETAPAAHPGGDGAKVAVSLRSGLGDGTYTSSYRVVSADSHPIAGAFRFVVGTGALATTTTAGTGTSDSGVATVLDAARWLSWAGLALLGGGWLLLTVWPSGRDDRRARRIVWTGWGLASLGAVLEVLLEGAFAAGKPVTAALRGSLVDATLHDSYGQLHSVRLVLLGLLAAVLGRALRPGRQRSRLDDVFWPLGVGIAYTFAATGHAATTSPAWVSIAADTVHLGAMAVWVGGLVIVVAAVLPRREPDEMSAVLPVFSRVAFSCVAALAVTGTYAAWRGVGSWHALLHTEYGLLVLAKVVAFGGLLALGNLSRLAVQNRVRRPVVAYAMSSTMLDTDEPRPDLQDVTTERLRRSVLVEVVLAALVLAVTSVLVSQPRGKEALAGEDRAPVTATAQMGAGQTASVTIDPRKHGTVSVEVALSPGRMPESVTATATEPKEQLGPIPLELARAGVDHYSALGVGLPVAGSWVVALVVTYSQFDAVTTDVRITLK